MGEIFLMEINRIWAMPNKNTFSIKPINDLIKKYINGKSIDPFANNNKFALITNDIDMSFDTDYHLDALDFLKMFEDESVDTVLFDPPYCYDKQTEILTKSGWKFFSELTDEDIVATLNTDTNKLEYHKPNEIIKKKYKGDMISFESQSVSLLVTPNHRMWTKHRHDDNYKFEKAIDIVDKHSWFQKACDYDGVEQEYFILPRVDFEKPNKYGEKYKPEKLIPMDTWLKFLGLFLSDGNCKNNGKRHNKRQGNRKDYCIILTQKKKHNLPLFEEVLNELGYSYYRDGNDYKINDKQLWTYLIKYGKAHEKYIDENIKRLSKRQLKILLKYLMIGDGTNIRYPKLNKNVNKVYHYTTNSYYTNSIKLMNDVSEICIKCGYGITITSKKKKGYRDTYNIHMLGAKDFRVKKDNITIVKNFDDYVYCVSVKNQTVLVKRNGRIVWSGNSPRQLSEVYKRVGKSVNMETTQASFWSNMKREIGRITKIDGIVISCGWNSGGIGKKYGFEIIEILLVPHGGQHNDTIVTVERKTQKLYKSNESLFQF